MRIHPDIALAVILAILLVAVLRWISLLRHARNEPWRAARYNVSRRHLESIAALCLATIAIGLRIDRLGDGETKQEIRIDVSSTAPRVDYEVHRFRVGKFKEGHACEPAGNDPPGRMEEDIRKKIEHELSERTQERDFELGASSWAFAVGGHDRQPYTGALHDSNMDLAFARAKCVTEVLSKVLPEWFEISNLAKGVPILASPGGARSDITARKNNLGDRVVDVFLYLEKREVG